MDIDIEDLDLAKYSVIIQEQLKQFTGLLTTIQYVTNLIHLFANLYFAVGIYSTSLIHPSLKILVITIATQYSFIAVARIADTLNSSYFYEKPIVIRNVVCIVCKLVNDSALITSCTSVLLLGLERLLATLWRRHYAKWGGWIGWIMLGVTVLVGMLFSLSTLLYDVFAAGTFDVFETRTSCQNLFTHPLILPLCWCFALFTFCVGTALLYYLYNYNEYMMEKYRNDPLQLRYQYHENIATLKVLIPAVAGYGVMIVLGVLISLYAFYALLTTDQNSFDVQMAFQILYMLADSYGICFVVYIFIRYPPMNKRLRKHLRWLFVLKNTVVNAINPLDRAGAQQQTDVHFKQLADVWNISGEPRNGKAAKAKGKVAPRSSSPVSIREEISVMMNM